jgi:hypothetical protein
LIGVAIIALAPVLMAVQRRWAYNFQLIEYDRYFWMTLLMVFLGTVAAAEAAWRFVSRRSCTYSPLLGFAAAIAAYNVFYPIANGALDRRPAEQRVYVIDARFCVASKGKRPEIRLRPADTENGHMIRLGVPRYDCRDMREGEKLLLEVKPGFFGTAWVANYTRLQRDVEMPMDPD